MSQAADVQVFEEQQLKGRYQLSPAQLVGSEGCWGVIIMAGIVLPTMCVQRNALLVFIERLLSAIA